jgi:hypothetical protein
LQNTVPEKWTNFETLDHRKHSAAVMVAIAAYDQWRLGTALQRRLLLMGLFEALEVRDGQILRYRPRPDRAQEVEDLVLTATGGRATVEAPAIPRPGQHGRLFAGGGKGGIPTANCKYRAKVA